MNRALDATTLPRHGIHVIEASAGTGKTHALTRLYLEAVLVRALDPERILVVTFTDAATRDLVRRVRQALDHAQALLEGRRDPESPADAGGIDALLADWRTDAPARESALARLRDAGQRYERHAISTIHAFAGRVLAEQPLASGWVATPRRMVDGRELIDEAAADLWRRGVTGPKGGPWLARHPSPDSVRDAVAPLFERSWAERLPRELDAGLAIAQAGRRAAAEALAVAWREFPQALAVLHAARARGARQVLKGGAEGYGDAQVEDARAAIERWLAAADPEAPLPGEAELLGTPGLARRRVDSAVRRGEDAPAHPLFEAVAALVSADHRWALLRAARERGALEREIRGLVAARALARGEQRYEDALERLDLLLRAPGGDRLAGLVAERWPLALVDECQDTDPRQYRILRRIYLDPGDGRDVGADAIAARAMVLVGDPKQAIYRFRGGDVHTYREAVRDARGSTSTLTVNHRSEPCAVAAVNALFADAPFGLDFVRYTPVAASVRSGMRVLHDHVRAGVVLWRDRTPEVQSRERALDRALHATVAEIVRLLEDPGVCIASDDAGRAGARRVVADDIAVLVPRNRDVAAVAELLEQHGIAVDRASRRSVFRGDAAGDLYCVLDAIARPDDRGRLRAALATPGWDWTLARLQGEAEGRFPEALARTRRWHEQWLRHGVGAVLAPLVAELAPRLLARRDGKRRLTDLRQLAERLVAAPAGAGDPAALLAWFAGQRARTVLLDESDAERSLAGDARVRVMTEHASKGLEFGIVFLPLAWHVPAGARSESTPFFHDGEGVAFLDLGSDRIEEHRRLAALEARAERVRVAYVAMTRAKHRTYAVHARVKHGYEAGLTQVLFAGLGPQEYEALDADACAARLERLDGPFAADGAVRLLDLPEAPRRGASTRTATVVDALGGGPDVSTGSPRMPPGAIPTWSYSALKRLGETDEQRIRPGAGDEAAEREGAGGAAFGRCFHDLMEHLDFTRRAHAIERESLLALADRHRITAGELPTLVDLAERTRTCEPVPGCALAALPQARVAREVPFLLPLAGAEVSRLADVLAAAATHAPTAAALRERPERLDGWMRGYLDLVFEFQGAWYVLDYKTDRLGDPHDYHPDALSVQVRERGYDLQAVLYALALRRWLRGFGAAAAASFGGVVYLFVRGLATGTGHGIVHLQPESDLLDAVESLLAGAPP